MLFGSHLYHVSKIYTEKITSSLLIKESQLFGGSEWIKFDLRKMDEDEETDK